MSQFPVPGWKEPSIGAFGPRVVVRTLKALALQHGLVAIFAITLIASGLLTNREIAELRAFAEEGVLVQAKLAEKLELEGSTTRRLRYYYMVGGVAFDAEKPPASYEYASANVGDLTPITYLPSDPSTFYWGPVDVDLISASRTRWIFETVLLAVLIQVGGIFARARVNKELRILRDFVAAPGEIIEKAEAVRTDNSYAQQMLFSVHLPDGRFSEYCKTYRPEQSSKWNVGDKVVVLVDPDEKDGPYPLFEITMAKLARQDS